MLQNLLGFNRYLKIFAKYKIFTLKNDRKEGDFFVFISLLKDEGIILDIGANLGIMTWHLLKSFNRAEIWAFEPIPENNQILRSVTMQYTDNRYRIFDCALGDQRGNAKMVLPQVKNVKMQGLSHIVHESIEDFNHGEFYEVPIETLDNLIDTTNIVQGIKLDVENFEYFVLKGGEKLIDRDKPIIYTELWVNDNRDKCIDFISGKGYSVHVVVNNKLVKFDRRSYKGQNFFFIPNYVSEKSTVLV